MQRLSSIPNNIDFYSDWYQRWKKELHLTDRVHRKFFEWAVIMETLNEEGMLKYQKKGVGFGVGNEPVTSLLASYKVRVLATDYDPESAKKDGWSSVHTGKAHRVPEIVDEETFNRYVSYREVNMNAIPPDIEGYDFVWSSCSLEHLGSRQHGINFLLNSMKCLKPGGIGVHTTEFTWGAGFDAKNIALYTADDLKKLQLHTIHEAGYRMDKLDFTEGTEKEDLYVSQPPYNDNDQPHLRLSVFGQKVTSCLLVVRKHG